MMTDEEVDTMIEEVVIGMVVTDMEVEMIDEAVIMKGEVDIEDKVKKKLKLLN